MPQAKESWSQRRLNEARWEPSVSRTGLMDASILDFRPPERHEDKSGPL